ncbi:MAG TPA: type B 50S ribosomal protein L31 [Pseudonocardia sp.]|jgi:large subunit ribosomal protein L31|nr:type B 50S ribosomal protein L31 [Pseudonocardia sp.]
MKPGIHPDYHPVVYRDSATGEEFLTRSTATSAHTVTWHDGQTYPLLLVDVSRYSHPFWTGRGRVLDTAGQVEKFRRRYGARGGRGGAAGAPGSDGDAQGGRS